MRHKNRATRLGVKKQHRFAMLRNMTLGLLEHGRIKTTLTRAKYLRTFVEPMVTRLKNPTVANLRVVQSELGNRDATLEIAKKISPAFATRAGGYTRIMKLMQPRAGDAADMAFIEWVEESLVKAYQEAPVVDKKAAKKASSAKPAKKSAAVKEAAEEKPTKKKKGA